MCADSRPVDGEHVEPRPGLFEKHDHEKDLEAFDGQLTIGDISCFGLPLARRLRWLEFAVGRQGRLKFENAKLGYAPFGGQYVQGVMYRASSRALLGHLIDELRAGSAIHVSDMASYYRSGKRWPLGMQIIGGKLVDVWDPKDKRKRLGL